MSLPLTLTEDSFRALAACSPWRWPSLHFTRSDWDAEAWVRRLGQMVVRFQVELHDYSENLGPHEMGGLPVRYIGDTEPSLRADGLVTGRPPRWPERDADDGALLEQDDPSFADNLWVAMLDPIELASGTVIADLAEGELRGRRTWWATVDAADGYEPRCTCCSLIWNEVMDRINCDERGEQFMPAAEGYPDGYRIGLDVQWDQSILDRLAETNQNLYRGWLLVEQLRGVYLARDLTIRRCDRSTNGSTRRA